MAMADEGWRDFDFFHGKWSVRHRRLKERLAGSRGWQEFGGTCICQPTLCGLGNFDDNILELPDGHYRAMTIRSFDRDSEKWSIWWLDGRQPTQLDVPVVGAFEGGVGSVLARETFNGRDVLVRFHWRKGSQPVWEQSMSDDDGRSWEVNWTMIFTRDEGVTT
jgi:hypothetical protein